ncbi:jg10569 [Pararge aegeria aegeria]|uniref:Jg10569 protein n=1 Tax=Pararge aegeria aegeria TaxID=348720 RepID=A0A8S4R8V8_9NEOP|nr:jg10569 [Pararge aegeria aegeria]
MMKKPRDAASTPAVWSMCQSFEKWEMEHPKSMEPPGPSPNLDSDVIKQPNKPKPRKQCGCDKISCHMKKSTH